MLFAYKDQEGTVRLPSSLVSGDRLRDALSGDMIEADDDGDFRIEFGSGVARLFSIEKLQ